MAMEIRGLHFSRHMLKVTCQYSTTHLHGRLIAFETNFVWAKSNMKVPVFT